MMFGEIKNFTYFISNNHPNCIFLKTYTGISSFNAERIWPTYKPEKFRVLEEVEPVQIEITIK